MVLDSASQVVSVGPVGKQPSFAADKAMVPSARHCLLDLDLGAAVTPGAVAAAGTAGVEVQAAGAAG